MPLAEYRCKDCELTYFAFPEDAKDREPKSPNFMKYVGCFHRFEKMAPRAKVVHSTEIFMLSQLDSIYSVHELNSTLMREATEERELKEQNIARKES